MQEGAARKLRTDGCCFNAPCAEGGNPNLRPVTQVAKPERCRCLVRTGGGKGVRKERHSLLGSAPASAAVCCARACVRAWSATDAGAPCASVSDVTCSLTKF